MYTYIRTEFSPYELYTVGFYDPAGKWQPESDHGTKKEASDRVIVLNGGTLPKEETLSDSIEGEGFTPGPWELQGPKIQEDFGGQTYWTIKPNPYKSKADPYKCIGFYYPYSGLTKEQQAANAELMASAPQLKAENDRLKASNKELIQCLMAVKSDYDFEKGRITMQTYSQVKEALNNNTK